MSEEKYLSADEILELLDKVEAAPHSQNGFREMSCVLLPLVGSGIKAVYLNSDDDADIITFATDEEYFSWELDSECCSHSWFADFYNIDALIGEQVLSVADIDLEEYGYPDPNTDGRGDDEDDKLYGYKIRTGKGVAVFSFRNSSNGYYGGSLDRCHNHTHAFDLSSYSTWVNGQGGKGKYNPKPKVFTPVKLGPMGFQCDLMDFIDIK